MRCLKRGFYRIKEPEVNTFQFLILISKYKILFLFSKSMANISYYFHILKYFR